MVTLKGFETVYPMKQKSEAGLKLNQWVVYYGLPDLLVLDNAQEETYGHWGKVVKKYHLNQHKVPKKLWNFGAMYTSDVCQVTPSPRLNSQAPYKTL